MNKIRNPMNEMRNCDIWKRLSGRYVAEIKNSFKKTCAWLGTFKITKEVDHAYARLPFGHKHGRLLQQLLQIFHRILLKKPLMQMTKRHPRINMIYLFGSFESS
ncbi:hypothetical protein P8452_47405 [Trifolium repens]|nr:hypothetical protein P8452_47405 [Trifolium repens]